MGKWPYTKGLHDLGNGCYAYLQPNGTWGYSNSGLIVEGTETLLVDTLMDLKLTREMLEGMRAAAPAAARIGTLVNTHSNPDHTNGNQLVAGAQIVSSTACLEEMQEQSAASRYPMSGEAGAFFQEVLGSRFDFSNIGAVFPSRTFDRELTLHVGSKEVRLLTLGPAHTRGDVVVYVPGDRTVFTGDIMFVGGHPVIWSGPVSNWIRACKTILEWDVETVVPGHGPITDKSGVRALKKYLEYVRDESRKRFDAGIDYENAARDIPLDAFADWTDAERIVVNVYACYREFSGETDRLPGSVLFGSMARYHNERKAKTAFGNPGRLSPLLSYALRPEKNQSMKLNETHDPSRKSWVASANHSDTDFPIQNLPLGIFREGGTARGGVAIGDSIFDLAAALNLGFFSGEAADAARAATGDSLNPMMALGTRLASILRTRVSDLLRVGGPEQSRVESHGDRLLVQMSSAEMLLPANIGDFTDFVCSTFHAQRVVRKPLDSLLAPVLCYMPVAYHGRASSVRVSGEEVRRPHGQFKDPDGTVQFGPSKAVDFELEVGAFISTGNALSLPIPIESAGSNIFGYCLLNDWSARDVQFWESMLGPFLSKSLSTTMSPWIVSPDALAPFRAAVFCPPQPGWPLPLAYLRSETDRAEGGFDIELEVCLLTQRMRGSGQPPVRIVTTNLKYAYWSFVQMIAHHTSNGCNLRPGDLLGSGTVSGPTEESRACLLEHTEPIRLPNGESRRYLEDGDEIIFKGRAKREGYVSIGFGECRARVGCAIQYG